MVKTNLFAAAVGMTLLASAAQAANDTSFRPFHSHVAHADLMNLQRRANAMRWPDMETVADRSQGVQLANVQELARHLGYTSYVAQDGEWGAPISNASARQAPAGLLSIHLNLPAVLPPESSAAPATGSPVSVGLSDEEPAVNAGARAGSPISITTADLVAAFPASA
jgi:hypothetical protein